MQLERIVQHKWQRACKTIFCSIKISSYNLYVYFSVGCLQFNFAFESVKLSLTETTASCYDSHSFLSASSDRQFVLTLVY